jgi:hypothetical protein
MRLPLPAVALVLIVNLAAAPAAQVVLEPAVQAASVEGLLVSSPAAGDFDEDGLLDVAVVTGPLGTALSVFTSDGAGGFELAYTTGAVFNALQPAVGDVDGDGHLDLVLGIGIHRGLGDGTFVLHVGLPLTNPAHPALGDLDGDGVLDLVVLEPGQPFTLNGTLHVFLGQGGGSFAHAQAIPSTVTHVSTEIVDVDGDGLNDLLTARYDGRLDVFLGQGGGTLAGSPLLTSVPTGVPWQHVSADFDGDGALDVAIGTGGDADGLQILLGLGDGTFSAPVVYAFGDEVEGLAVADLDLDGHLDLATPSSETDELGIWRGSGDGTFTLDVVLSQVGGGTRPGPAVGSLDGDAFPDLVVLSDVGLGVHDLELVRNHTYGPTSPYADLGGELAGTTGFPVILAEGAMTAGAPFDWSLRSALPGATAWRVVGLTLLDQSFKGGVLKPTPDLLAGPFTVDAEGRVPWIGTWPQLGGGYEVWVQDWIQDAGGPKGFAASAGLRASVPVQ